MQTILSCFVNAGWILHKFSTLLNLLTFEHKNRTSSALNIFVQQLHKHIYIKLMAEIFTNANGTTAVESCI